MYKKGESGHRGDVGAVREWVKKLKVTKAEGQGVLKLQGKGQTGARVVNGGDEGSLVSCLFCITMSRKVVAQDSVWCRAKEAAGKIMAESTKREALDVVLCRSPSLCGGAALQTRPH